MLMFSSTEYRAKLGDIWRPGMLVEMVRIFQMLHREAFAIHDELEFGIRECAEGMGWNLDDVIAVYTWPIPLDEIPDPEERAQFQAIMDSGLAPVMLIVAPEIKSIDDMVRIATKLINLKAFL